jgi:hypothetical protein
MAHSRCTEECGCPFGNHDYGIRVDKRPKDIDLLMTEGLPATIYRCGYMAFGSTVIMVDRYTSGKKKGLVKRITVADATPTPTGDWVTSSDPKDWDIFAVEELTVCTGRDCEKYRDKCPYCSGTRFYFKNLDSENKRVEGSYGRASYATIGLGYREEYRNYQSEQYLSG